MSETTDTVKEGAETRIVGDPTAFMNLARYEKLWCSTIDTDLSGTSIKSILKKNERRVNADLMRIFLGVKVPVTLWGPVGARKTRTAEALGVETDSNGVPYLVITIQPSTTDPTIIHGMYYVSDTPTGETVMKKSIPEIVEMIVKYHEDTGGYVILFLDEMTTCTPSQQHALLGMITHGKYGPYVISDLITVVMAANPQNTVSAVHELGEQFINRGGHISWYGDKKLFEEDWTSGFGHQSLVPSADTQWFVTTLMNQAPDEVFRNVTRWKADDLVPYDSFEHSERIVTDHGKLVDYINKEMRQAPDPIRHHYLVQVTQAMMGKEWANRMKSVCDMESKRFNSSRYIEKVSTLGITHETTLETLKSKAGSTLLKNPASGDSLTSDQLTSLGTEL